MSNSDIVGWTCYGLAFLAVIGILFIACLSAYGEWEKMK
jgi:hypothetical protein